jgi:hypothetical protein
MFILIPECSLPTDYMRLHTRYLLVSTHYRFCNVS